MLFNDLLSKNVFAATGSPPSSTLSLNCTRPSTCSPPGVVCNSSDTISNPCPTTTAPTTAATTAPTTEPTTTTANPKTKKSHCRKKHDHRPLI
ncbi:Hypothetical predicted protein [Mytilus galloprovincialis]|uniref:Uncharacterized protein n=1 Tax=Mytilus galloprovincialis TaxID=29158 RepID=A0A8B6CPW7_MYTGA|nr:Hypothetical predicted protein [Mytilus galloprovincialis]